MNKNVYYVYVYIDPRNFEEFYYGKGQGNRKNAHLYDESDSEKAKRIKQIEKDGLEPIIKVIARNLSESEAYLIEKTLIWKLGRTLTNVSSGHFADKFRPHSSFHLDLQGFDYEHGLFYVNIGEGHNRSWKDCRTHGFLAAGQGKRWSDPVKSLNVGDIIVAFLKGKGYVGVGRVIEKAKKVLDFKINGQSLREQKLGCPSIFENCDNERCEYLVRIQWIKAFEANEAKWKRNSGLFATQLIKASLDRQPKTIEFIEKSFSLNLKELLLV